MPMLPTLDNNCSEGTAAHQRGAAGSQRATQHSEQQLNSPAASVQRSYGVRSAPMEWVVDTGSSQNVATSSQMPLASSAHSMP